MKLKKKNCNVLIEWPFDGWRGRHPYDLYDTAQNDWNQTFVTMVNQASAKIHQASLRGGADEIRVSPGFKYFLQSLPFYDITNEVLSGRYKVVFDDKVSYDEVYVYRREVLNGPEVMMTMTGKVEDPIPMDTIDASNLTRKLETEMNTVTMKLAASCPKEDVKVYSKKLMARIQITGL